MNLFLALLSAIQVALSVTKGVPGDLSKAVTDLTNVVRGIVSSGAITDPSTSTVLAALKNTIAALKLEPDVPQDVLEKIGSVEAILEQGMAADTEAQVGPVDPDKIQPIEPQK